MKAKNLKTSYKKISSTAWSIASCRTLSDIPFSSEIFDELQKITQQTRSTSELEELQQLIKIMPDEPTFEARYKLVNRLLKENKAKQILEIAAGFSPRGIKMAQDLSTEYIEIDLPGVINEKRSIVEKLVKKGKISNQSNLHLNEGNALDMQDLLMAIKPFKKKPIAVVNEGLLNYLTFEEKTILAKNIHQILKRFGGVWITPDTVSKTKSENKRKARDAWVRRTTGIIKNRFENIKAAQAFFENLGFIVESHSFIEILDELSSSQKLNLSKEQVIKSLGSRFVFVMRPQQ